MMVAGDISAFKKEFGNKGIYLSAYWYDSTDVKTANLYGHFYLDFDSEADFEKARNDALDAVHYLTRPFFCNIPMALIRIFFSGQKGIHLVIPAVVFGVEPSPNLNHHYKSMAERIGMNIKNGTLDFKVYDRRRLFRVTNSIHQKTGLHKIPLSVEELRTLPFEDIKEKAKQPVAPKWTQAYEVTRARSMYLDCIEQWKLRYEKKFSRDRTATKVLDFTPSCVQELIDAGPQKGQRNNTAAALVSFQKRKGLSEQEVWDFLIQWNRESMNERELRNVMQSVYQGDYEYGCSTLENLATCEGSSCKLWRERE
jgi:hypothetical protein